MADPEIEGLLSELLAGIQSAIGDRLVGLYLFGSLAIGGFEPGISDVDLLAATNGDVAAAELARLERRHAEIVRRHPDWDDRIEVIYISVDALGSFKERRSQIAVISPGEPLHVREEGAGADWLMNWHQVTHGGQTLFGPDPRGFITPTSDREFVDSLLDHMLTEDDWTSRVSNCKAQSYVTLTMCRTLVAMHAGTHATKRDAAAWTKDRFPVWASLIDRAIEWRTDPTASAREHAESVEEMRRFVSFVRSEAETRRS